MDIHIARQTNRFTTSWGANSEAGTGGEGEGTLRAGSFQIKPQRLYHSCHDYLGKERGRRGGGLCSAPVMIIWGRRVDGGGD